MSVTPGFLPFFSVMPEHGYFADGRCPAVEWQPAQASASLLRRVGCHTVAAPGPLAVYADESRLDALRSCLQDTREPFCLTYRLKWRDPAFDNFTGGVPVEMGRVLFLSSAASVREDDTGMWRMHPGAAVAPEQYLPLDDEHLEGLLGPSDRLLRPAPIVQLHFGPQDLPVPSAAPPAGKRFRIRFAARATLWKYFLFGAWPASSIEVVDLASQVQFGAAQPESLPNGRVAITVRSTSLIALQHQPTQRFQLRSREDEGLVLIERLPAAAPGRTGAAVEDMPVSEIYV